MSVPKVYINGKYYDKPDAKVSVYDHGLLYGDGVFEGIRVYNSKVFRHQEHIDRLYESAKAIDLKIPLTPDEMKKAVEDTVTLNHKKEGYIRLVVTRGPGTLGLDPRRCDPNVIIIVDDISLYPPELYENGMPIVTSSIIRNHPNALSPRIKSLNYLNNILAKIEAIRAGCLEALMLNANGEVAECTGDNIFVIKHGVLKTPGTEAGILEGVTRNVVIELAKRLKIEVKEVALTRHDIYAADECFLTGSAAEVIAVTACDGRSIGTGKPGPITKQLREAFQALTRE
ncbi:branched-chain-amino-acid transaminase [Tuwongella immobilis]|uniref:Branched-chain-amino-acid aminotransferase n=1 Tax=Tuwongella immobilis TaxID=692036 RepID=A0A6C2YW76_9BACT|nr:branched-chain-amino-acid transaminase [Tuwongella immobilis]VIP05627.1 branched-chain amino acid aminotransferase : Branched-chain amino acid aminotransferase OS=Planctomyces maris DSM 8797 GN=PM8797T_07879 PE=3 SV=1: Aminotran_4 [Tuwongella immobilis]VTS08610.1 branched-chain amino acid aminotransferase : Branched-chain amino acid aminotransferase OS=Planctomyces maris DSM 8797 GN=PM8797T_07879 PE=3 SV=1: Aminotran_4 [Tuwongella immobilis]